MKKTHIVLIAAIAAAIGAIISTIGDASTYENFTSAKENEGTKVTVIGYLDKEAERSFDPRKNEFIFTAIDKEGVKSTVVFNEPEPQDFARSEEITMKGYMKGDRFVAEEILMKCPSKYAEENEFENTY